MKRIKAVAGSVNRQDKGDCHESQPARHGRRAKFSAGSNGPRGKRENGDRPRKSGLQSGATGLQHAEAGNALREDAASGANWKRAARELGFPETLPCLESRLKQLIDDAIEQIKCQQKCLEYKLSTPYEKRLEAFLNKWKKELPIYAFASWYEVVRPEQKFDRDSYAGFFCGYQRYIGDPTIVDASGEEIKDDVPVALLGCRELLRRRIKSDDVLARWVRRQKITCLSVEEWNKFLRSTLMNSHRDKLEARGYLSRKEHANGSIWAMVMNHSAEYRTVLVNGETQFLEKERVLVLQKMMSVSKSIDKDKLRKAA